MQKYSAIVLAKAISQYLLEQLESRRLLSGAATNATIYVDQHASGAANGTSWINAYPSLVTALADIKLSGTNNTTNQVLVAAGTYTPGTTAGSTFSLRNGITIQGGYLGGSGANANTRSPNNVSFLSGALGGGVTAAHVVTVPANQTNLSSLLDGFTVTGGNATSGSGSSIEGAGIFNSGSASILNCIITGNQAQTGGGVFSILADVIINGHATTNPNELTLTNCLITGNKATNSTSSSASMTGNGVELIGGNNQIDNCTFSGNTFTGNSGAALEINDLTSPAADTYASLANSILYNDGGTEVKTNITMNSIPPSPVATNCDIQGGYSNAVNSIVSDPGFTSTSDFHLLAASPCINTGANSFLPSNVTGDLDFKSRIVKGKIDMGAYEFDAAGPAVIYVDPSATGPQNGSSWTDAYRSLQSALALAGIGTTVKVAQGTYLPSTTGDVTASFFLDTGVTIDGGYGGFHLIGSGQQDTRGFTTTLSGALTNNPGPFNAGDSYHVVTTLGTDSTAVLNGVSITSGGATGGNGEGAGIYSGGSSANFSNCTITNCIAAYAGGGLYSFGLGSLNIAACGFSADLAASLNGVGAGGAIYSSASLTISGTSFVQNAAFGAGSAGGAIYCQTLVGGALNLSYSDFTRNSASNGGAIEVGGGSSTVSKCNFDGNTAAGDFGPTAGTGSGGAVYESGATNSFIECTFVGNQATGTNGANGGAIYSSAGSSALIYNTTFTQNSAVGGGAGNGAANGGAIFGSTSQILLDNSILWADAAPGGADISTGTGAVTINNSDVVPSAVSGSNVTYASSIAADPLFVRTPSPGSDSVFGTADDDYGNVHPGTGSPAIDAGLNSLFTAVSSDTLDPAYESRFVDYPGVHDPGAIIDLGAFEANPLTVTASSFELNNNPPDVKFTFGANIIPPSTSAVTIDPVNADSSLDTAHPVSATAATYNSGARTVTFALPISMADGNYRATLAAGSVSDTNGNVLLPSASVNFFILPGDANQDRIVNALDFNALATNYGKPGNFTQGDFDYSGVVGSGDFDLLAARFGKTLAAPAMSQPVEDSALSSAPATSIFSGSKINDDSTSDVLI